MRRSTPPPPPANNKALIGTPDDDAIASWLGSPAQPAPLPPVNEFDDSMRPDAGATTDNKRFQDLLDAKHEKKSNSVTE